jgi:hypothetical protein
MIQMNTHQIDTSRNHEYVPATSGDAVSYCSVVIASSEAIREIHMRIPRELIRQGDRLASTWSRPANSNAPRLHRGPYTGWSH